MKQCGLLVLLMLALSGLGVPCAATAQAQVKVEQAGEPSAEDLERARIDQQRSQEMARQAKVEAACYQRFAVNDCLVASRTHHREVLNDLKRQEASLNDQKRKLSSSEQLRRIEDNISSSQRDQDQADRQRQGEQTVLDRQATADRKAEDVKTQEHDRQQRLADQVDRREQVQQQEAERKAKAAAAPQERQRYETKLLDAAQHRKQLQDNINSR
ncbi:MAG: hypothetical protein JOY84_04730, partial [Curvibacter sp.]|nr:hypothetical protein [Curvibacter sp.]